MLIEPRTSLDGPQLAGRTLRVTPPARHRLRMDAKASVPMPDGARLRADVYRPREPGRYPALVSWSAYPRFIQTSGAPVFNNEAGVVGFTVACGYAHVRLLNTDFDGLYVGVNGDRNILARSVPPAVSHAMSHVLDREWAGKAFNQLFPRIMRRMVRGSKPREEYVRAYARIVADEPYGSDWYDERSAWPVLDKIEVPTGLGVNE